jgi:hypothetical protein
MDLRRLAGRCLAWAWLALLGTGSGGATGGDLPDVRAAGVLRHPGVPYANFVSGSGDGIYRTLVQSYCPAVPCYFPELSAQR